MVSGLSQKYNRWEGAVNRECVSMQDVLVRYHSQRGNEEKG